MMPASPERKSNPPRKAISRRLRYEILRRDGNTCRYCGLKAGETELTIDHVVPVALGGTDEPANLVAACKDCNAGKTSSSPDAALVVQASADALRWSAAMQVAAGLALDEVARVNEYVETVDAAWEKWSQGGTIPRPGDWSRSARSWCAAELPVELVADAINLAMSNRKVDHHDVWRYTCGIVWKRIAALQESARAALVDQEPTPEQELIDGQFDPDWVKGFDDACDMPTIGYGWYWFRALSDVVDGPRRWNARRTD